MLRWPALAAACIVAVLGGPSLLRAQPVEWIVEEGNTLVLRLVMEEHGEPCGGELTVDPNRKMLRFEGAGGEIGCRRFLEASFFDLEKLRVQRDEAGFVLEVDGDADGQLVFLPLPHFRWFGARNRVRGGALHQMMQARRLSRADSALSRGAVHEDAGLPSLALPRAAPVDVQRIALPPEVSADVSKAVELIQEAMGRPPAADGLLREALYGPPADATVSELLESPGRFSNVPVRLRARLLVGDDRPLALSLEDEEETIPLTPEPGAETSFVAAGSSWAEQPVEVVGLLRRRAPGGGAGKGHPAGALYLSAWECTGPEAIASEEGKEVTLDELFERPGELEGKVLRVAGAFRGRNALGDLPARSQRSPRHWIIKSDRYAVWVTGRKAEGEGWSLDLDRPGPADWLEVVGRLRWRKGFGYIDADRVRPVVAPPGARVRRTRRTRTVSSVPTAPANVVFNLPLEQDALGSRSRIILQFDRSMEEESFGEHVRLRYADEARTEPDIAVRLAYDDSLRALVISPVRPLETGRRVEVLLLEGVLDVEGRPLGPRAGRPPCEGAVDRLTFDVGSASHQVSSRSLTEEGLPGFR